MVWEADIFYRTEGKDGRPALEILTGDTIYISVLLKFEFCEIVWFWNNQLDDTKPMFVRWIGVSHRVGSYLCYWIISEKVKVLSRTTVQNLNSEETRDPHFQQRIHNYHGSLEDKLGNEDLGTSLDVYESFINYYENGIAKGDPNEEVYQGPTYYPDIYVIIDRSDE